ncbi:hypothetical protein APTSU1_000671500 [Apodemus speciosus]|uniref:Uncharacterized protein n=1 Tax=Apodemus speciosus TaxID=105296 RepID=A0ABQ0EX79_APOSI
MPIGVFHCGLGHCCCCLLLHLPSPHLPLLPSGQMQPAVVRLGPERNIKAPAQPWTPRKKQNNRRDDELESIEPETCSQVDARLSPVEDSKEVIYAQLCQDVFLENTGSLPFRTLQGISTHETCVYATLRLSQEESQSEQ